MSKPTFTIKGRPQAVAAAWLLDTGEFRPALEVLRSRDELTPELRAALVDWMRKGAKRKPGYDIARGRPIGLPPSMVKGLPVPTTSREKRAHMLFFHFALSTSFPKVLPRGLSGRGRPKTLRGKAVDYVAKQLGVHRRTADAWFEKFKIGSSKLYS